MECGYRLCFEMAVVLKACEYNVWFRIAFWSDYYSGKYSGVFRWWFGWSLQDLEKSSLRRVLCYV